MLLRPCAQCLMTRCLMISQKYLFVKNQEGKHILVSNCVSKYQLIAMFYHLRANCFKPRYLSDISFPANILTRMVFQWSNKYHLADIEWKDLVIVWAGLRLMSSECWGYCYGFPIVPTSDWHGRLWEKSIRSLQL